MSSLEARRTFLGKAVQAFYELDEVPAYKHTYRASDPVGWDRRSRLVQAQREKELKVPFSYIHDAQAQTTDGIGHGRT